MTKQQEAAAQVLRRARGFSRSQAEAFAATLNATEAAICAGIWEAMQTPSVETRLNVVLASHADRLAKEAAAKEQAGQDEPPKAASPAELVGTGEP